MENKTFMKNLRMCALGLMIPAMPMISRGIPVYTNGQDGAVINAENVTSPEFSKKFRSAFQPTGEKPVWTAFDISGIPGKQRKNVLLVWYNDDTSPYDHSLITEEPNPGYNNPASYVIESNTAPGGKAVPSDGWVKLVSVENNTFHSRQHLLDISGFGWLRIVFTAVDGTKDNKDISVHIDIFNVPDKNLDDWIFYGDSITQMAMNRDPLNCLRGALGQGSFSSLINEMAMTPGCAPVQENGGTGYMKSADGAKHIGEWLKIFPGKFVALAYGTNDAWSMVSPDEFYENYENMVKAVLKAGKIPLVPVSIPWSSSQKNIQEQAPVLATALEKLFKKYPEIIKGPDFYKIYKNNPDLLSPDGVHPSLPLGLFAYRIAWAQAAYNAVYAGNK
jgi:lysophospholipase L1-like esterase